jgi:hypothetical protein
VQSVVMCVVGIGPLGTGGWPLGNNTYLHMYMGQAIGNNLADHILITNVLGFWGGAKNCGPCVIGPLALGQRRA